MITAQRLYVPGIVSFLLLAAPALAGQRHVPSAYPTIQQAIDAAVPGDEVILAPGTYAGDGNRDLDYRGKAITVRGTDPTDPAIVATTIIDCQGTQAAPHRGFAFRSSEGPDSILAGLTIQNGYAPFETIDGVTDSLGGGVFCSGAGPTIRYCVIRNNKTGIYSLPDVTTNGGPGGGIYARESSLVIEYCIISGNTAAMGRYFGSGTGRGGDGGHGGGIYCISSSLTIRNGTIVGNSAGAGGYGKNVPEPRNGNGGNGGGIHAASSSVQISSSTINGNVAGRGGHESYLNGGKSGKGGHGGAIYCSSSELQVADSTAVGNKAGYGGGAWGYGKGGPGGHGGGIHCDKATIRNSLIAHNWAGDGGTGEYGGYPPGGHGGGIYCDVGQLVLASCTFAFNRAGEGGWAWEPGPGIGGNGGGVYTASGAFPNILNCVFANNTAGKGGQARNNYQTGSYGMDSADGGHGGGIYCQSGSVSWSLFANNTAGKGGDGDRGKYMASDGGDGGNGGAIRGAAASNCTFASNHVGKGGIGYWGGTDGLPGTGDDLYMGTATDCTFIDTGGLPYEVGFFDADGPDNYLTTWQDNNYHLVANSPCINAGDPAYIPQPGETDLDGHPRVMGGAVDLGADEWTWPGDVNGDSHVDQQDLLLLAAAFGTSIPQPAYARTCDFNGDGAIDVADLLYLVDNWGK